MKLELLHEFVVLAKHQSFTNAAKELYQSQPNLSMHLRSLEKELGFVLVNRSENAVSLTPVGTIFLDYAQKLLAVYHEAQTACAEAVNTLPSIRIGSLSQDSDYHKALMQLKPPPPPFVFVDLGLEQSFLKALRKGIVDCGVCYDYTDLYDTQKDDRFENVVFERIGTTKLSLCVMRDHPFASAASISRSDFQKKTIVIYSGTHFDDWQRVILNVLGEDLELRFHLSPIQSLQNLTKIDLKDMIYLCSRGSVSEYLLHRDDIVIIDTVDGRDLFSADAFAYLAENKAAAMLARALKDELERMASAHR